MDIKYGYIIDEKDYLDLEKGSNNFAEIVINEENGIITRKDYYTFEGLCDYRQTFLFKDFRGRVDYYLHQWSKEFTKESWTIKKRACSFYSYGRSTSKYYPYCFINNKGKCYALNLIPNGDWRITLKTNNEDLLVIIDRDNTRNFNGKTDIKLDVFIVSGDSPEEVYLKQQEFVRNNYYSNKKVPVSYNTWLDRFYNLDWDNMTAQAKTCANLGVETFIVDAGWFGELPAWTSIGDWREKENLFKNGKTLNDFADYVRSLGLKFGIWMEVDKIHKDAPLRLKYPDLFVNADNTYYHYNLLVPEARELMFSQVSNIIEKYDAKWLKIDCNNDLKKTPGDPHVERWEYYNEFLDRLQKTFPELVVENCASGAMKGDIGSMSKHATNFATDTVYAEELIRIQREACKIYPPCFINNWCCCHPAKGYFTYGKKSIQNYAFNLKDGTGLSVESFPINYLFAVNFLGNLSLTGNYAGFSKSDLEKMKKLIKVYKDNKEFIFSATYLELESTGYAYVLKNKEENKFLLFVFNNSPFYYNAPLKVRTKLDFLPKGNYKIIDLLTGKKDKVGVGYNKFFEYKEVKILEFTKE